ncbi:calmodulin-like protein 3 [Eucalyptus grandis]|nr:calmodulin-like protein 3 [Eucalyptus grandis]
MTDSLRIWLSSLQQKCGSFLQELKLPNKASTRHKRSRNPKTPPSPSSSKFHSSTPSSFAASEVSAQLRQVFELIDADGDGKISPTELSRVLSGLGHVGAAAADEEARVMVKEIDRDGDGRVDLDEFLVAVLSGDDDLMDAFLIFDANKDGLISAKELQRVLQGVRCEASIEDCRRMIRGVDTDGDGFVNFEEFRSMMRGCFS